MVNAIKIFLFSLGLALSAMGREEYTRNFDKSANLRQGQALLIEHKLGDIIVHTHAEQDLTIHAEIHVSAGDRNKAEQFANQIQILTDPSSAEFAIRTRYPEFTNGLFSGSNAISYSVRYDLTIPESTPLTVRNGFGAVSVSGLKADGTITTSHGSLTVRDGRGARRLVNSFGSVELTNNAGPVTIQNTNGSVKASDVKGPLTIDDRFGSISAERIGSDLAITNSNGSVDVVDCGGATTIKNAFASVTVRNIRGDLVIHNGNGKVEAVTVKGSADLNTSFGEVSFSDIGGNVSVRSNNSQIQGVRVKGSARINNSFGRVAISEVDRDVDVQSGNGEVSVSAIRGDASLKTSFAAVDASNISGALSVIDSNGSVTATKARAATVKTSFGGVTLQQIAGAITVDNQNGAVEASSDATGTCQPISIRTSFSPIRVHLRGNPNYRVAATTSFGKIQSDFPLTVSGSISADSLSGTIGEGRCDLKLTGNNGTIQILNSGSH